MPFPLPPAILTAIQFIFQDVTFTSNNDVGAFIRCLIVIHLIQKLHLIASLFINVRTYMQSWPTCVRSTSTSCSIVADNRPVERRRRPRTFGGDGAFPKAVPSGIIKTASHLAKTSQTTDGTSI